MASKTEVSEIIEAPVAYLFDEKNKITTEVKPSSMPGLTLKVPAYSLPGGAFIWGATAMMLAELEEVFLSLR
jgi:hypothetical protein